MYFYNPEAISSYSHGAVLLIGNALLCCEGVSILFGFVRIVTRFSVNLIPSMIDR